MYSLRRFGIKLGLDVITRMLKGLGEPHTRFHSIHLAGSNGKGSTASLLAAILQRAGYRVGLYTSPHLVRFNERIKINGKEVSDRIVVSAYDAVHQVPQGDREPTFFEYTTAMAFHIFQEQQVDWAVIETGMGGRLDATNILTPDISVITNISLEHQMYLGSSIESIAKEKAGIIKKNTPVVTGVRQNTAVEVIEQGAKSVSAPLYRLGKHFRTRRFANGTFTYFGLENTWRNLKIALCGRHQFDNAALALAVCEILHQGTGRLPGQHISLPDVEAGLLAAKWPGRLEIVARNPVVLLDGAHNLAAIRNLTQFLSTEFRGKQITLVAGILDDKSYRSMLRTILPVCYQVILTQPRIDRSLPPEKLAREAKKMLPRVSIITDVAEALKKAIALAGPEGVVCAAGSLYVIGEIKEAIEKGLLPVEEATTE